MVENEVKLSEVDKETAENMVDDLTGYLKPPAEGVEDVLFDNKTLDMFIKKLIIMLNETAKEGNITKYVDASGKLEIEVSA